MENALAKIAISTASDETLSKSVERINQGFDGGRVTKTDAASWYILRGAQALSASEIDEIRRKHFNQVKYLESLVRKLKATGRESLEPSEFETIQSQLGQLSPRKKQRPTEVVSQENKAKPAD